MNIQKLQLENQDLKRKLARAQAWMKQEVSNQVAIIWKTHFTDTDENKERTQEEISEEITQFIWEVLMLNVPKDFMENIISAEILYHSLEQNDNFDGLGIISSYHKAMDVLVENFITKWFRKYAQKQGQTHLRKNEVMEKTFNSIVNQNYILGAGRLFHILKMIRNNEELQDYGKCFKNYLEKYNTLWDTLLSDEFFSCFSSIINSDILWKKRHVGKINLKETKQARKLLIWDFTDQNCLIYKLIETQKIEY